jgi:hypothetical protein
MQQLRAMLTRHRLSVLFFYHDGTERPVQRPGDADEQEEYYSGKKRCHTIKNILLIGATCAIEYLSPTHAGKWHEKSIVDDESYRLPAQSTLYQDMGFQGFTVATVTIRQPTKKPRGGELTPPQKEENRRIASEKMRIEHAICGVKRCRIVKDKIRYWQDNIRDMVMEIACGLHNFRLRFRPWHYDTLKS